MLEHVQIIKENNHPKFAVIDFEEYKHIKELLSDENKLEDYLDFLHIKKVKGKAKKKYSIDEVKNQIL